MNTGQYTRFYVKRKSHLFPLIEKYANIKIKKGVTHGQLVPLYHRLLTTNVAFRSEVDSMIDASPFKNAVSYPNKEQLSSSSGGGGFFSKLISTVGNIFGTVKVSKEAELESDKMFYELVLNEQKKDDTVKVLVLSGIALAFMGLAIYLVKKAKK